MTRTSAIAAPRAWPGIDARREIGLACCIAAVYVFFPNRFYTFDALSYAADVREASLLFHPHHLLYSAFCWASWRFASLFGPIDPLALMAVWSALTTAGSAALVSSILRKLEVPAALCLGAALLFAFSYGPWFTGTTAEVYGFTLLLEAAAFRMVLEATPERRGPVVVAAALTGLAMLFHQTSIFLVPASAWLVARRTRSWRVGASFAAGALLAVAVPYVVVGVAEGRHTVHALERWVLHYTHGAAYESGRWGRVSWENVPQAVAGIAGTLLFPRSAAELFAGAPLVVGPSVVALAVSGVALAVACGWLVARRIRAGRGSRRIDHDARIALIAWLVLRALFSLWWEPANLEWWLLVALPATMVLATWLAEGSDGGSRTAPALVAVAVVLFASNFALRVYPDSRLDLNEPYATLAALRRHGLGPRDLVVGDRVELIPYARYFAHFTLQMATLTGEAYASERERDHVIERFRRRIVEARERGRVWVLESELDPSRDILMLYPQWQRGDYERCYAPLRSRLVPRARFVAQGRPGRIFALR